ncbi:TPA: hypothetical protein I6Z12_001712 [Vibrio cholerae]|nr:hypothetical protein [Vibrio cholerae]
MINFYKPDWNELQVAWNSVLARANLEAENGDLFPVQIVYQDSEEPKTWDVHKNSLYVGKDIVPHENGNYSFSDMYNDKKRVLQAAILIAEAARFSVVRNYLWVRYSQNKDINYETIKPAATTWKKVLTWLNDGKEVGRDVNHMITCDELRAYAEQLNSEMERDEILKLINAYPDVPH